MTKPVDHTMPNGRWAFDEQVTQVFDNMLERSIPQYGVMRQSVFDVACLLRQPNTAIVDLGCSRGEALAPLVELYEADNRFVGVDISEPMLQACRNRFAHQIDNGVVEVQHLDLRTDYPNTQASVVLAVLTIQFTPIEYRQRILKKIYDSLLPGGGLILVEKILGHDAHLDTLMVELYYRLKSHNGYSQTEIDRKRLSLEGVLVPVTAKWNEDLLHRTGFNSIDCFWRWMNFSGWVAIKNGN